MQPYTDKHKEGKKIRTFSAGVESSELVWHRDLKHRQVKVIEGSGWFFQRDEEVPFELKEGTELFIPKMEWHRLFKAGDTDLVLEIVEKSIPSFKNVVEKKLAKGYGTGLGDSTKDKRRAQFNKQAKMDDDNPAAYKPAPGDARAKTKPSKYTKAYHKKYGKKEDTDTKGWGTDGLANSYKKATPGQTPEELEEKVIKGLQKKSDETGIAYGILKKVYDRGLAAWRTGHRPGATPHQWAFARVNSFITGGKTQKTTDADLWAKHKGKKESTTLEEKLIKPSPAIKQKLIKIAGLTSKTAEKILGLPQPMLTTVINQLLMSDVQYEEKAPCPPATQKLEINTKNRDATIKKYNYGPLNVDEPGDYWEKIAKYWDTNVAAAKKSVCANCVAFDISPRMLDCMPGETSDDDGVLGYCWMHHFKCHSARSCHTWAKGGPIDKDEVSLDWGKRAGMNEDEERIPRKKGQHTGSSSHSDLYTDEDPEGTIHGLGFKDAATAKKGIQIINKSDRTHAHKVQATLVMQQRAKVAIARTKDPEKKANLQAAYDIWTDHLEKLKKITQQKNEAVVEGKGKYKGETWEQGFERRVVKTTKPEHLEKGFKWRIKGKERDEISIKLYKKKPDFKEFTKQMRRVAGHEFGG